MEDLKPLLALKEDVESLHTLDRLFQKCGLRSS